jgi:hypothetical protein
MRCASAEVVTIGLTPGDVGSALASATYRPEAAQASPEGSIAEVLGELPMRAEHICIGEARCD